jgi:hypothetical protein
MPSPSPDTAGDPDGASGRPPLHRTPGWVKAFQVGAVVLVLLFVVLHLTGLAPRHGLGGSGQNPSIAMDHGPRPS